MHDIVKKGSLAGKLFRSRPFKDGEEYRLTKHCIRTGCDGGELLFHTLTGELVLLERGESFMTARKELAKKGFIVPAGQDDLRLADEFRHTAALIPPPQDRIESFTILTTTDCNARCYYCYEKGRRRVSMSEETALDVAAYVSEVSRGGPVSLSWFGGEPLYNIPAIDLICGELTRRGVTLKSHMTSNGYYLTPEIAVRARDAWKLEHVQITVDGTEDVYRRTKAYTERDGNPLKRVLDNAESAMDTGIRVFLRLNVDASNAEDMKDAVDLLGRRFKGRENCMIQIAFLSSFADRVHEFEFPDDAVRCYFSLLERAASYGLKYDRPFTNDLAANRCIADSSTCEVILPDGRLGKCEHFSESELIGSIYSPERDMNMVSAWKERKTAEDMPECENCPLYPRCINLKKCEWTRNGCPAYVRMIRIRTLEEQLLQKYSNWKTSNARGNTRNETE
ncbi:MAG: radical SAM protein [Clostridia bacterium]|nr:radical SAM protein [Clostridia bacterium]MBP5236480.1 radical SAM protein [Clostridia bacterium]